MKFSTTSTLAALMLMSSGTDARIGGGQRELHGHHHSHGHDHGHSKGKTCDPDIAGQCFTNGIYTGSDCKLFKLGGSHSDYRCTDPTPAPTPKKCNPNQNPTYTPECPSGFTCEALLGGSKKNVGQCMKQSDRRVLTEKQCDPDIAGQCFTNGKYTGSDCKLFKLGGSHPDYRCTAPTPPPKEPKCTRQCSTGKPCGDSCISDGDTCHKLERGKACWAKTKCTKFCDKGQACGNSCISKGNTCHLSPGEGFACNKEDY